VKAIISAAKTAASGRGRTKAGGIRTDGKKNIMAWRGRRSHARMVYGLCDVSARAIDARLRLPAASQHVLQRRAFARARTWWSLRSAIAVAVDVRCIALLFYRR